MPRNSSIRLSPGITDSGHLRVRGQHAVLAAGPVTRPTARVAGSNKYRPHFAAALNGVQEVGAEKEQVIIFVSDDVEQSGPQRPRLVQCGRD